MFLFALFLVLKEKLLGKTKLHEMIHTYFDSCYQGYIFYLQQVLFHPRN